MGAQSIRFRVASLSMGLVFVGSLWAPNAARAGRKATSTPARTNTANDERVEKARIACLSGDVATGVRLLAELYAQTRDAVWLFNQGRCYQQNAQPAVALARFREYLKLEPEDASMVAKANQNVAELEADLRRVEPPPVEPRSAAGTNKRETEPAPATSSGTATTLPPPKTATTTPDQRSRPESSPHATAESAPSLVPPVVVSAVALAGLALGAYGSYQVHSLAADAESDKMTTTSKLAAQKDKAHSFAVLQWVGYGVGSAATVGAALLWWRFASSDAEPARVAFSPVAFGQEGLFVQGTF